MSKKRIQVYADPGTNGVGEVVGQRLCCLNFEGR